MSYGISFGVIDLVKRIISMTLAFVTCFFCFSPTLVRASFVDSYVSSNFAQFVMDGAFTAIGVGAGSYFGSPEIGAIVGHAVGAGINDIASWYAAGHTDQEVYDAYNTYVTDLESDLGTTTLIDGGVRIFIPVTGVYNSLNAFTCTSLSAGAPFSFSYTWTASSNPNIDLWYKTITSPFDGYVIYGGQVDNGSFSNGTDTTHYSVSLGTAFRPFNQSTPRWKAGSNVSPNTVTGVLYADLYPNSGSSLPTIKDISVNSRPTSIVLPVGYYDSNNTLQVVKDTTIVDETNNIYYNPVTDISNTFTDWVFDYSTRTYTLILEDGSSVTVVYGDENIIINEGDTVYNVYYLIPSEDPGGSDTPSDPDNPGTDDSGFWSWWKQEWADFRAWLSGIFSGDSVPSSPDSPVLPGGEDNPDTEEDESWAFLDLLLAVKDGIWKVITGFISTAVNGIVGLIQSISNIGDYFDAFDADSPDNILGIYNYGGEDIWD